MAGRNDRSVIASGDHERQAEAAAARARLPPDPKIATGAGMGLLRQA